MRLTEGGKRQRTILVEQDERKHNSTIVSTICLLHDLHSEQARVHYLKLDQNKAGLAADEHTARENSRRTPTARLDSSDRAMNAFSECLPNTGASETMEEPFLEHC